MDLLYLFFVAIVNSIDNIGVGAAYSIAGVKVQMRKNLVISFMAFAVSYISSLSAHIVSHYINEELASIISLLLMTGMGIRMIYEAFEKNKEEANKIRFIGYKEALAVGTALAIDDVASSLGSGLIGYGAFMVSIPYFIISILIFVLGNRGTRYFNKLKIGRKANIAAGIVMILLGLSQIFE